MLDASRVAMKLPFVTAMVLPTAQFLDVDVVYEVKEVMLPFISEKTCCTGAPLVFNATRTTLEDELFLYEVR
jgi:hypothetical protein